MAVVDQIGATSVGVTCYWCGFRLFDILRTDTATLTPIEAVLPTELCAGCAKQHGGQAAVRPATAV